MTQPVSSVALAAFARKTLPLTIAAGLAASAMSAGVAKAASFTSLGYSASSALEDASSGSALARITAMQTGQPLPAAAPVMDFRVSPARLTRASFVRPQAPLVRVNLITAPRKRAGVRTPDFFGTRALMVGATPFDADWKRLSKAPAPRHAAWRATVRKLRKLPAQERIRLANTFVNHALAFRDDAETGVRDYWASAAESFAAGQGDCEDFALAKLQLLRQAGFDRASLFFVIAKDNVRRLDHAVLVARIDGQDWVLDNGTDLVLLAEDVEGYRPVLTYAANTTWMHGYEQAPSVMIASAEQLAPSAIGAAD